MDRPKALHADLAQTLVEAMGYLVSQHGHQGFAVAKVQGLIMRLDETGEKQDGNCRRQWVEGLALCATSHSRQWN